jgi:hypothetical protein
MRIKIWASLHEQSPNIGPYRMLDIIEREGPCAIGDITHYGEVINIPSPTPIFTEDADQGVVVKLNPASLMARPAESVFEKPPSSFDKIEFFPISVDTHGLSDEAPPHGTQTILATDKLTIEDVSHLMKPDTFAGWKKDCFLSKDTASSLDNVTYALVHRVSSPNEEDAELERNSTELINLAVACLALIRPTRRGRALNIRGLIQADGTFYPKSCSLHEPTEVPTIQKLFTIRKKDIDLLTLVLPEFIKVYQKDANGRVRDEYEPLRMAVQLYEQAYAISYWKARHILWWSAIEALYGNNEETATARIYALFGKKNLADGYRLPIYESGDIPSCFYPSLGCVPTLGMTVPLIYEVRNASAHGQKVPDSHFSVNAHPFGQAAQIDVLAEAATFVIRKTIIAILRGGFRDNFKHRDTREEFWLYEFGLDRKQSKKRLREMNTALGHN